MQFGPIIATLRAELAADKCWTSMSMKEKTAYTKAKQPPKKPIPAKPNRANHLCWSDGDVEHHHSQPKLPKPHKALAWSDKDIHPDNALKGPKVQLPVDLWKRHVKSRAPIPSSVGDTTPRLVPTETRISKANLAAMSRHSKPLFKGEKKRVVTRYSFFKDYSDYDDKLQPHGAALDQYKEDSSAFNTPLRTRKKKFAPAIQQRIENLKHLTSNPLVAPEVVYRGNRMTQLHNLGHRFTDRGFTGTSTKPDVATNFTRGGHFFAIHLPKGAKGYYLDQHASKYDDEHELLLHPDTHYEVIGHTVHSPPGTDSKNYDSYWRNANDDNKVIVTHLAVVGQGRKGKTDTPDFSLSRSAEGRKWLAEVKASLPDWFKKKPKAAKVEYIKKHPAGKIAKTLAKKPAVKKAPIKKPAAKKPKH